MVDKLTVTDYLMRRQLDYVLSEECHDNACSTVDTINKLLDMLVESGIEIVVNPTTKTCLTSGWRPKIVNSKTPGAAVNSKHISCQAADIYDPTGYIDEFLLDHQSILQELHLFMEHPSATKGWCHVQTVPPRSGKLIFYP